VLQNGYPTALVNYNINDVLNWQQSKPKNPTTNKFYGCINYSQALIASSLFPTKIGSTVPNYQKLCIRLVFETALEKQNRVDCMTEKLNILKRAAVMLLLLLNTSRQL